MPVAGVPASTPVAGVKVTPAGSAPDSARVGGGEPVAVTVKLPNDPTAKAVAAPLVIAGAVPDGALTVRSAVAALPAPPSVELTFPVTLCLRPAVVPVTFTVMVQLPNGPSAPFARLTLALAATALILPRQEPLTPFGVATTRPEGRLSVNARPVRVDAFGLFRVRLRLVVPLRAMLDAPKTLPMVGGRTADAGFTMRLAVAVPPAPPSTD